MIPCPFESHCTEFKQSSKRWDFCHIWSILVREHRCSNRGTFIEWLLKCLDPSHLEYMNSEEFSKKLVYSASTKDKVIHHEFRFGPVKNYIIWCIGNSILEPIYSNTCVLCISNSKYKPNSQANLSMTRKDYISKNRKERFRQYRVLSFCLIIYMPSSKTSIIKYMWPNYDYKKLFPTIFQFGVVCIGCMQANE